MIFFSPCTVSSNAIVVDNHESPKDRKMVNNELEGMHFPGKHPRHSPRPQGALG